METSEINKVVTEYRQIVEDFKRQMENLLNGGFGIGGEALAEEITKFTALPGESYSKDPHSGLKGIRENIGDCHRCPLHSSRKRIVFGQGNPQARLLFVGEAPGYEEDLQGEPFVGAAGMLLTRIMQSVDFDRDDVYIANIVKCRPPGNRNPATEEIETCLPFLMEQIRVIGPWMICAMGAVATQSLLHSTGKISNLRGKFHDFGGIKLMPTYHPAFLLRNPERKREVWEDMKAIRREYERLSKKGGR